MPKRVRVVGFLGALLLVGIGGGALFYWPGIVAWYEFHQVFESLDRNRQGLPEFRHRQTGIVFVRIPAGNVALGSPKDEEGAWESERPAHEVWLDAFLIARYELSQREWWRVMGSVPSLHRDSRLPVDSLSWHDCLEFNKATGLSFPTEAQWEKACRAGTTTPFAFGTTLSTEDANFNSKYTGAPSAIDRGTTLPVDTLSPNAFGLFHMHGNVSEWCEDVYDEDFYKLPEARERNPVSHSGSGNRCMRGGSFKDRPRYCRSASRAWEDPLRRSPRFGYRPAYPLARGHESPRLTPTSVRPQPGGP